MDPMPFGTDLIGAMHRRQSEKFELRRTWRLRWRCCAVATIDDAKVIRREGGLGSIAEGHQADLIAVHGDPPENIRLLSDPLARLSCL
jgi:imidazolonepropionase-like amidohydrolase